jgi:hypothetical protein
MLLIHPGIEDFQIDPFEFVYARRCHCVPFALLGYDVTTNTPDTAFHLHSTPFHSDLIAGFSMSIARGATLRDP